MVSRGTSFDVVPRLLDQRGLAESDSKTLHQLSDREVQRCGDSLDIPKCNVSLPALNPADVSTVEIAFRSECFLRQSGTLPKRPHPTPESPCNSRPPPHS